MIGRAGRVGNIRWFLAFMVSFVALLIFIHPEGALARGRGGGGGELVVSGRAEVKAQPDMAVFHVGVETKGETMEEARQANAAAMHRIRDALLAAGTDEKDLQTKGFQANPEWQYNPSDGSRTFLGYRVYHSLEVTVTDLTVLGLWLDEAMAAGANQISGPTFGIQDSEELEALALSEAVKKAQAKAQVLADSIGVKLWGVAHVSEQVHTPITGAARAAFMAADSMEMSPTVVMPGEITVTATVSMTYRF